MENGFEKERDKWDRKKTAIKTICKMRILLFFFVQQDEKIKLYETQSRVVR